MGGVWKKVDGVKRQIDGEEGENVCVRKFAMEEMERSPFIVYGSYHESSVLSTINDKAGGR